jgi:hypothetical protein
MLYAAGAQPRSAQLSQYSTRGRGEAIDEAALQAVLAQGMEDLGSSPVADSDPAFACLVRASLALSRREAADMDLWTQLNVTAGWAYAAWRWQKDGAVPRRRVAGAADRSALARLWWLAELCRGGLDGCAVDSPELRERVRLLLRRQDAAVAVYERPRLFARPGLTAPLIAAAGDDRFSEEAFRGFAKACVARTGVLLTGSMDVAVLERTISTLAERAWNAG